MCLGNNATLECINRRWFENFHSENFNLQNKFCSDKYSGFDNDVLKHY